MKKWIFVIVAALTVAAAAGVWYFIIIRDRREVQALVNNVAALACKKKDNLPHSGIFKHTKVDELFDEKVRIKLFKPAVDMDLTREDLKGRVAVLLRMVDYLQTEAGNVNVEVSGDQATFSFDAHVSGKGKSGRDDFSDVYQCSGSAVKRDGKWRISLLTAEPVIK
ncbi:MAG: hypothetical protein E7058_03890 [Lentisphaerae bacterium]|nr:hypothetical protein [Lentisphaerota bacterium]